MVILLTNVSNLLVTLSGTIYNMKPKSGPGSASKMAAYVGDASVVSAVYHEVMKLANERQGASGRLILDLIFNVMWILQISIYHCLFDLANHVVLGTNSIRTSGYIVDSLDTS